MPPFDDLVKLLVICSVIVLPALAITTRFALKPIVDALLRLREGGVLQGERSVGTDVATELRHLRAEVAEVRAEVARLQEVESFHAALRDAPAQSALPPPE
ncbi:MAG TPA: hypothetical protein VF092_18945 [Longimicrobium sp.]